MINLGRNKKIEYGDWQTPENLAEQVCNLLKQRSIDPQTIIEPTCGVGNFFFSALAIYPKSKLALAFDVEPSYIQRAKEISNTQKIKTKIKVEVADFFTKDWQEELKEAPEPLLIIGNPPWVTNSQIGSLKGENLPMKGNFQKQRGLDALTGRSNFDISEWMIMQMIEWLQKKNGMLAMLCKTSVARKILMYAWKKNKTIGNAAIHLIDAKKHFNITADACLLTVDTFGTNEKACRIYDSLSATAETQTLGLRDGLLVANIPDYETTKHLVDGDQYYKWRSGVKHDCSDVMELVKIDEDTYLNGLGEEHELEATFIFPLLKGSDLSNGKKPKKWVLVPQKRVGEDTANISSVAPKTWQYLQKYGDLLDARISSIYKNKPRFSIFGIGEYAFSSWKIAIPALYKKSEFTIVGPYEEKPVLFDDTVNFIPLDNKREAETLLHLLNSEMAQRFYKSFIFWDNKRPITVQLLKLLDIDRLTKEMNTDIVYSLKKYAQPMI